MSETKIIAIDLGASGGKMFIGFFQNNDFQMKEFYRFEHEAIPLWVKENSKKVVKRLYWNDLWIYQNILEGLRRFTRNFFTSVNSIGIDTWGSDGIFLTKERDILDRLYCYRDYRLDTMCDELKNIIPPYQIYSLTGIHFWPFNISNQVLWFLKNRVYLTHQVDLFLSVGSLFYFYLCGAEKIEYTWASVTQLLDAQKKEWSQEIFNKLQIPLNWFPNIVKPGTYVGDLYEDISKEVGFDRSIPMRMPAMHDTASAFVAAPLNNPENSMIISSGTWSLIGKLIPQPILTQEAFEKNFSNEGGIDNIRFLKNSMGTWLLQELRRKWDKKEGKDFSWEEMTSLALKARNFTFFIDPDNSLFYNPSDMEEAIKQFCKETNQNIPQEKGEIIRGVYESLALKYAYIKEQMEEITHSTIQEIYIVGGGAKNELLNQFTANATNTTVYAGPYEATAIGNIMTQAKGMGVLDIEKISEIIKDSFQIKKYIPMDIKKWREAYNTFKNNLPLK